MDLFGQNMVQVYPSINFIGLKTGGKVIFFVAKYVEPVVCCVKMGFSEHLPEFSVVFGGLVDIYWSEHDLGTTLH